MHRIRPSVFEAEDEKHFLCEERDIDWQSLGLILQSVQVFVAKECLNTDQVCEERNVLTLWQKLVLCDRSIHARKEQLVIVPRENLIEAAWLVLELIGNYIAK